MELRKGDPERGLVGRSKDFVVGLTRANAQDVDELSIETRGMWMHVVSVWVSISLH